MSHYEEELQKKLEAGQTPQGDDLDVKAYRHVFSALKKEPEFELPSGFADRIMAKVEEKRKKESARDIWWLGAGIFFIFIAFIVAIVYTGFKLNAGFLSQV